MMEAGVTTQSLARALFEKLSEVDEKRRGDFSFKTGK
jgi:hypothetical protein